MSNYYPNKKNVLLELSSKALGGRMNPLGYLLMACIAVGFAILIKINFILGIVLAAGMVGATAVIVSLLHTELGFYLCMILSVFVFYINRMVHDILPVGIAVDLLTATTFLGIYIRKTVHKERYFKYTRNPITWIYVLYLVFTFVQLFNPSMFSVPGWAQVFRKAISLFLIYLTALYLFKNVAIIKRFFKIWIVMAVICGAYACFQQWHGLLGFEDEWVVSDPIRYGLYFQGGTIRKFSFLSDPTAFGILMASSMVFAIVLCMGNRTVAQRNWLLLAALIMALGMTYSGTRTAYVVIPAGVFLFVILTITNKKTLLFTVIFSMIFCVLIFGPFHSISTVNRIRTAFEFSEDESLNVRDVNRAFIQPYIWKHPIGGGVNTSGAQGNEYNPTHPLAGFPPDSGYLKAAIETGWTGLALTCIMYFIVLQTGIRGYYQCKSQEFRNMYAASITAIFVYVFAHYAQVAIGQLPGAYFFYGLYAVIVNLKTLEQPENI
ncbi:O-antigen ligase family protein [Chitinophaga arvensicola]|uniref:O-antigen ligase like membrane protein n=1 Tax=Chitinophaga arvensicola TaxID=29529 RepID=A0A1I0S5F4_9BACT|nr:O-antigen ligase family protein [Chitinophaga arvensicola]SEW50304.1 O-antigen ligase like membrane protein [Chitinophaga arvensicola]